MRSHHPRRRAGWVGSLRGQRAGPLWDPSRAKSPHACCHSRRSPTRCVAC